MNIKTVLAVIFALLIGIGGTVAYFYFQRLDRALDAPPVPPAKTQEVPKNEDKDAPAPNAQNPPLQRVTPISKGSLKTEDLAIGGISYGAAINDVKAAHGEPQRIENKHKWRGNAATSVYEYYALFDLYVIDGIVRGIKVDHLNSIKTTKNISVGDTIEDVLKAYGEPNMRNKDRIIYYLENNPTVGIEFEFEHGFLEEIRVGLLK